MSRPHLVPGDRIKVRAGIEPHALAGKVYTIARTKGGSPGYPNRIMFTERDCSKTGADACQDCENGWMWDPFLFSKEKPLIKEGDVLICNSSDITHFAKGGKYTVKGVLNKRSDSGHQNFLVVACQRILNGSICSCPDGARTWTFNDDFDLIEPFQPITLEESQRAINLPSIDDVANFFGIKSDGRS